MPGAASLETLGVEAVLGPSVVVKGEIHSREDLTIEGEVEGTVEMAGYRLTVTTGGNVRASVRAKNIDVLGTVQGSVEASDKVYIRKGAQLLGDIQSAGLVIEEGGTMQGKVDLSKRSEPALAGR
jgi:cytoskeletal protein CcmA (bactofilin family)